jgi:hypothetical protein
MFDPHDLIQPDAPAPLRHIRPLQLHEGVDSLCSSMSRNTCTFGRALTTPSQLVPSFISNTTWPLAGNSSISDSIFRILAVSV